MEAPPSPIVNPWIEASKVDTRWVTTALVAVRFAKVPRLVMFGWAFPVTLTAVWTVETLLPLILLSVFPNMSHDGTRPNERLLAFKLLSVLPWTTLRPTILLAWILLRVFPWMSTEDTRPNESAEAFKLLSAFP